MSGRLEGGVRGRGEAHHAAQQQAARVPSRNAARPARARRPARMAYNQESRPVPALLPAPNRHRQVCNVCSACAATVLGMAEPNPEVGEAAKEARYIMLL